MHSPVATVPFTSYAQSVAEALEASGALEVLSRQQCILIKPNLVNATPPPVTLPVGAVEALVLAIRRCSAAEVVIGEGTGDAGRNTAEVFRVHGYERLSQDLRVPLLDLNEAPLVRLERPECRLFPEFWLPTVVLESFVISFAVLKAHSLAEVTLSLKNMMGCAPPRYYQEGRGWKKSAFHRRMHRSVFELNRYRKPDLALVDASVGLAEQHLGGPTCDPPVKKFLAGFDPVAVDAVGAALLGVRWQDVGYLRLAHGVLGDATARTAS